MPAARRDQRQHSTNRAFGATGAVERWSSERPASRNRCQRDRVAVGVARNPQRSSSDKPLARFDHPKFQRLWPVSNCAVPARSTENKFRTKIRDRRGSSLRPVGAVNVVDIMASIDDIHIESNHRPGFNKT